MNRQVIAIDWDDTYSADPELWKAFIESALARKHTVLIVTCRMDTDENREDLMEATGLPAWRHIFTSMSPKRSFCAERGWVPTIWIDDMPESILFGR